jgi:hypothetical protein
MGQFEDEYLDVLYKIESAVLAACRKTPSAEDYDAHNAINALIRVYQAELNQRQPPPIRLQPTAENIRDAVQIVCDIMLGRKPLPIEKDRPLDIETITLAELVACLKRVRKSIERWTKEGGRRGYLDFISEFL